MGNILHNNRDLFHLRINRDEYWDFCLSNDNGLSNISTGLTTDCLVAYIDTTNPDCVWFDDLIGIKDYYWEDSVSVGVSLEYIGYTGMDNGYIRYQKDRISNSIFYGLFKNSTLSIGEGDYRLRFHKVNGNNQIYDYQCDIVEEDGLIVSRMNGGFYQGFFETVCDEYKILPDTIDDGWHFEVTLKKTDLDRVPSSYTLNDRYPDNKGMFLYIGTRAENKWWTLYNVDTVFGKAGHIYSDGGYFLNDYLSPVDINESYIKSITEGQETERLTEELGYIRNYLVDGYWSDCDNPGISLNGYEYTSDEECEEKTRLEHKYCDFVTPPPYCLSVYQDNAIWYNCNGKILVHNEKEKSRWHSRAYVSNPDCCNFYFDGEYVNDGYANDNCESRDCMTYFSDVYLNDEFQIDKDETLYTSDGYPFNDLGIVEYKTDNKFMFFDRTCDGYNIHNWDPEDGETVVITGIKAPSDMENYFLLFNRTCHGYNINTIRNLIDEKNNEYNVLKDLFKNALAFQITDDGKIGYKYLVQDCDAEDWEYKIESEFSNIGTVTPDEWHTVNIKIIPVSKSVLNKTMRITIYVDGKIRLVSQELPMLNLKPLDDNYDKQQGVPFNISLGGGTQGLCDVIYLDYYKLPEYVLPLEKNFGGTFIGFIKSFKMYDCQMSYQKILANNEFEKSLL